METLIEESGGSYVYHDGSVCYRYTGYPQKGDTLFPPYSGSFVFLEECDPADASEVAQEWQSNGRLEKCFFLSATSQSSLW